MIEQVMYQTYFLPNFSTEALLSYLEVNLAKKNQSALIKSRCCFQRPLTKSNIWEATQPLNVCRQKHQLIFLYVFTVILIIFLKYPHKSIQYCKSPHKATFKNLQGGIIQIVEERRRGWIIMSKFKDQNFWEDSFVLNLYFSLLIGVSG